MPKSKTIWITWQHHRRTEVLAKEFGANLIVFTYSGFSIIRYLFLSLKTIFKIIDYHPDLLIVQNPSIVLAFIASFIKPLIGYRLIIDRHSNFKFKTQSSYSPKWKLFHWVSHYTIRTADLTIVTNDFLKQYVNSKGGCGFVLQDKIPNLIPSAGIEDSNKVVFISTFSNDEPFSNFIIAASFFSNKYIFYITGNYNMAVKKGLLDLNKIPNNVKLTGFLSEKDYLDLLESASFVVIITTNEYTLNCGAYEAIALGKPMILGDTQTIREYFSKGAVYTNSTVESIRECIETIDLRLHQYREEIDLLKNQLQSDWNQRFLELLGIINDWGIIVIRLVPDT